MHKTHFACLILGTLYLVGAETRTISRQAQDNVPKLDDILAVAKSPLEPVTMSLTLQSAPESSETTKSDFGESHKQTTRAADQDESSATKGDSTDQTGSTKSATVASTPETTTTTESAEVETDTTSATTETETTTTQRPDEKVAEASPTTTTSPASSSVETTTELRVETSEATTEPSSPPTTTEPASPPTTTEPSSPPTTTEPSSPPTTTTTTEPPTTTTTVILNELPTTTTESPKEEPSSVTPTDIVRVVDSTTVLPSTEPEVQTTTAAPTTALPSSEPDFSKDKEITSVISVASTEAQTNQPTPTTAAPEATTATPSTTEKPVAPEEEKTEAKASSCSHLPTYSSDEIQKVFREETTYKNGTIKGKFTYINFDQRYRLVQYTRLPYGPVKIDLVEELGRPEQSGNQSSSPIPPSEIPNAVLQLRNILPNSLFGFPFLSQANPFASKPVTISEPPTKDSEDNKYFYSTDTIATPDLMTPRVPVSLPPGHRKYSPIGPAVGGHNQPAADTLSQIFNNENLNTNEHLLGANPKLYRSYAESSQQGASHGTPRTMSSHSHHYHSVNHPTSGLVYTHVPPPQYQYAPITVYPIQPPSYISSARSTYEPALQFNRRQDTGIDSLSGNLLSSHQAHQPHSHEHFMAPFMFAQAPQNDQPVEGSRLKLRIKSAKSLNVGAAGGSTKNSGTKSAQLRLAPSGSQQHLVSPVAQGSLRQHRQQRLGKQSQDLSKTVNTSPVVYHVLKSPVGRMYSLSEFNRQHQQQHQGHSIAYDQDN